MDKREKEQRSVIGYVITSQECMEIIKSMEIDEIKQYGSYKQNARINKYRKHTLTTMLY